MIWNWPRCMVLCLYFYIRLLPIFMSLTIEYFTEFFYLRGEHLVIALVLWHSSFLWCSSFFTSRTYLLQLHSSSSNFSTFHLSCTNSSSGEGAATKEPLRRVCAHWHMCVHACPGATGMSGMREAIPCRPGSVGHRYVAPKAANQAMS